MPETDCFLQYVMRCNAEFYYVGKIPRTSIGRPSLQRRMVLKWFYSAGDIRHHMYFVNIITSDKGGKCVCPRSFVCLSVCLLARLLKNACMDLNEMLRVDRCRDMDELDYFLSPIRIIVRMPEPDCFLRYRMRCNAEFYYVGKISRTGSGRPSLQRGVVLKWFYSAGDIRHHMYFVNIITSDKGGKCVCPRSFVCLSVC